jgi:hypothetical protein
MPPPIRCEAGRASSPGAIISRYIGHGVGSPRSRYREISDRECLTVDLIAVAGRAGHEAHHVARVGKSGWKDWNVVRYARDGDLIPVTNNASDFRRRYAAQPLHAGLVILIPAVDRSLQQRLFKTALDELAILGEPVNRVIEGRSRRRRCDFRHLRSSLGCAVTPVGIRTLVRSNSPGSLIGSPYASAKRR